MIPWHAFPNLWALQYAIEIDTGTAAILKAALRRIRRHRHYAFYISINGSIYYSPSEYMTR